MENTILFWEFPGPLWNENVTSERTLRRQLSSLEGEQFLHRQRRIAKNNFESRRERGVFFSASLGEHQ